MMFFSLLIRQRPCMHPCLAPVPCPSRTFFSSPVLNIRDPDPAPPPSAAPPPSLPA